MASSLAECRKRILAGLGPTAVATREATGGADALIKLESEDFRTVLLDSQLEDLDAEELAEIIRARFPEVNVVVLQRGNDAEQRSFDLRDSTQTEDVAEESRDGRAPGAFRDGPAEASRDFAGAPAAKVEALPKMIGTSHKMQQLYRLARLVAPRDTAALIVGATGTGKELVARGIHELSRRSQGPFIVVNCAAIPESLLEAELFGFTRGAFTGAFQSRLGRIHAAHGGTLLLDEVGELPLSMQAKLLRFVQEGEVQRLGSADLFRVNARLIAATNADLLQRVRDKQFREDLYYRLAVFPIALPRLQDRWEDILPLARHFLAELCAAAGVPRKTFSAEAAHALQKYSWPGNVRELQHWVERAFVLSEANEEIGAADLSMFGEPLRD
ncbi:MAG TPA: sigma-54 dependent transcriptional regulator [Candidatus Acidoferrales bacterium]|nr:sigma-54 dependent transcriptional regulator [Candidatus Acidoferrales bacterium]